MLNYVGCDYIVTSKEITPATSGYTVGGIKEGDKRVKEEKFKYSSDVGFGSNYAHYKNLLRLLKFEIDTEGTTLKMEPTMVTSLLWKLKGVVDTGFATDVDTRRSITGYSIYFCEALIVWQTNNKTLGQIRSEDGNN